MKIKRLAILFSVVLLSLTAASQVCAATLTPAQQKEVVEKINASASKLKSMSCSFTQTKHLKMLADKIVSSGHLYFRQPDCLRWEYDSPYRYLFVFNGKKVHIGSRTKKQTVDVNTNKVYREVARTMMNTITGKALSGSSDFTYSIDQTDRLWTVTLTPKKKELKQVFRKLELIFSRSQGMITEINIYEKNGDRTNIRLTDISTNTAINESLFAIP